jgi:hypothetical protein
LKGFNSISAILVGDDGNQLILEHNGFGKPNQWKRIGEIRTLSPEASGSLQA